MKNWKGLIKKCNRKLRPNFQVGNAREAAMRIAPQTKRGTFGGPAGGGKSDISAEDSTRRRVFQRQATYRTLVRSIIITSLDWGVAPKVVFCRDCGQPRRAGLEAIRSWLRTMDPTRP